MTLAIALIGLGILALIVAVLWALWPRPDNFASDHSQRQRIGIDPGLWMDWDWDDNADRHRRSLGKKAAATLERPAA